MMTRLKVLLKSLFSVINARDPGRGRPHSAPFLFRTSVKLARLGSTSNEGDAVLGSLSL